VKTIEGPALFLAHFAGDTAPFDTLAGIAGWARDAGFVGVQIPSWDGRLFDLSRVAESDAHCDEVRGTLADAGVELTELSTHLQGQLIAVRLAARASRRLGRCGWNAGGPGMPRATSPRLRASAGRPSSPTASTTSGDWHGGSASGRRTRASDRAALLPSG
jgi:hypothetical protein